jgi:hypothetical protein
VAVVLLLVIISASYLLVRVGALGLELTGIDRERANFQALSAFTNSGYTTKESEEMVRHPVRRRIISVLMILGHAGMVTMIGTFAKSLMEDNLGRTALNVGFIFLGLVVLVWLARWQGLTRRVHDAAQKWLAARYDFHAPSTEEMLRVGQGYGVSRVRVDDNSPVAGRFLKELDLRTRAVQVLGIERDGAFLPVPGGDDRLHAGDVIIVYGKESAMLRIFHPDSTSPLKLQASGEEPT